MEDRKNLFHTYEMGVRRAEVILTKKGFEVELYEKNDWSATRKVHQHSESYAEDVAENWVQGMYDLEPEEKDGSFYGYNEKDDNFYPGLDD
jgi:hypothetical protein